MIKSMQPAKLSWVTVNLYIYMVFSILLILLSILGGTVAGAILGAAGETSDESFIGVVIGFIFGIGGVITGLVGAILHFLAARGLKEGKRWGWVLSLILMILNLLGYISSIVLAIPAILGLVGLFDREVQDYASH
ncbi:hypothetical protein [Deinococcus cellulosilyticus]|uniref:DUF4064 domain-containing protein n=1 Tax=Deinococcus cellulosilyticus (strain DSM 18568 / NBRC 106333 / KACC 11606 / 5516J-15) TaxID=1223518 RepID=A0A511N2N6_DEIC1|nr:hypothetical protein [Deinococcus cellulosilyticus]GEM47110.1 hypothetical protein DC3_27450 [Deinococcus cellulosilyticus NBRC 106333 = KACC 11606]